MTILTRTMLALAVLFVFSALACSEVTGMTSSEEVRASISSALGSASTAADIEAFLSKRGLPYTYDRFAKRYQSIIRKVWKDTDVDHAIVIYIYVNDAGTFVRAEVRDSFT